MLWKWVSDPLGGKSWVQGKGKKCFMLHHLASTNLPMTFRALLDPIGESLSDPSSGKDTLMRRSELLKTNISVLKFSVVISDKVLMLLTLHSSLDTSNQICFLGRPFRSNYWVQEHTFYIMRLVKKTCFHFPLYLWRGRKEARRLKILIDRPWSQISDCDDCFLL